MLALVAKHNLNKVKLFQVNAPFKVICALVFLRDLRWSRVSDRTEVYGAITCENNLTVLQRFTPG